jgi:hypothetical protein
VFNQVKTAADCKDNSFYIENKTIKLCPTTCSLVKADPKAEINILYGCKLSGPT